MFAGHRAILIRVKIYNILNADVPGTQTILNDSDNWLQIAL